MATASISKAAKKYLLHFLFILIAKQSRVKKYLNKKEFRKRTHFKNKNEIFSKTKTETYLECKKA